MTAAKLFAACALALAPMTPVLAQTSAEDLKVTVGKSLVIDYPTDIGRISTSNPDVVDAVAVSTREVLLHAKGHGVSTVVIWAKTGQRTFYNVSVEHNLEPIRKLLTEAFPTETIDLQSARDSVVMTGRISTQAASDKATALVASLAKTVVNNLQVNPNPVDKQILLRVKFAELDRNYSQQFGINLMSTGALNTPGVISTGQFGPPAITGVGGTIPGGNTGTSTRFNLTDALNVFAFRPDLNIAATIKALQSTGVLQILAEPNLVTTDGKEASFLVGGEFPVPVLQGGSNAGAVTIMFREYGIRLTFNPNLTPNKTLKMAVRPEVSSIDLANSVTFSGFRIPALATRRMDTNIELAPGQSFVIGGLIDDRLDESMAKIPGLSAIPILGELFKSRQLNKGRTELVVLVTPEIVDPLNPTDPKPLPKMPLEFLSPMSQADPVKDTNKKGWFAKRFGHDKKPDVAAAEQQVEEIVIAAAAAAEAVPEPKSLIEQSATEPESTVETPAAAREATAANQEGAPPADAAAPEPSQTEQPAAPDHSEHTAASEPPGPAAGGSATTTPDNHTSDNPTDGRADRK
ncbi:MAG: pilus assembly protein N-terminal domain-containing protein [Bryobacteraceae bacterium]